MLTTNEELLYEVESIARTAGAAILEVYHREDLGVQEKEDKSPLTEADLASHKAIISGLKKLTPSTPVQSEESDGIDYEMRKEWQEYWLVDPLDGTKEFINRNGEFTVNIALIRNGKPVLGVVYVPVTNVLYAGGDDLGAFKQEDEARHPIQVRTVQTPVVMVASRRHGAEAVEKMEQAICERIGPVEKTSMGSSLKLCLVAEGRADIYPRLAPTSEWDTAAAHAVVNAAGGQVVNMAFQPLAYNKPEILNPWFLVLGGELEDWRFLESLLAAEQ